MDADLFAPILLSHARRYPMMQPADWYKLAYQAALGCEHAAGSIAMIQTRLEQEIEGLGDGPEEPLIDSISGGGRIVRVHLRPYAHSGFSPEALAQAFVRTTATVQGSAQELNDYLGKMIDMAAAGKISITANVLTDYFRELSTAGFPPIHHSAEFRETYCPAYRVVARDFLLADVE